MRITLFILFFSILFSKAANGYSQGAEFTLDLKSTSIKKICEEIENNSDFRFIFAGDAKKIINKKVDLKADSQNLVEILDTILSNTNLIYNILENQIVIYKDNEKEIPKEINKIFSEQITQQSTRISITGKVTDAYNDEPIPGTNVVIAGTSTGTITDIDGVYELLANEGDTLIFSFIGFETQKIEVGKVKIINIRLSEQTAMLEEAVVVAFGKQKKESVISSIETIKPDELRVPSSNLTTAFAGRMAGLISYQTTGEPGQDNAQFFIRGVTSFGTGKVDPLILIDNIEMTTNDLSRLHPDDIASFSILKDATATAVYGARGANGVILITTKEGKEGSMKVSVRVENIFSAPTKEIELADPITYMKLANEASKTRDPLAPNLYSYEKIDNTIRGTNPHVYPATDWMNTLFKDMTINQKVNVNLSGGGKIAQYYISGSFAQDNGILKVDKRNNFNNNIDLKKYLVRSNININLTKTTKAKIRMHGTFDDYVGPIPGGSELYANALRVSPVRFPPYYEPDEYYSVFNHILFGNAETGNYLNPYAEMVKGYKQSSNTVMLAQFELEQDLSKLVSGLNFRILGNTIRSSNFSLTRSYSPFYYEVLTYNRNNDKYQLQELNTEDGNEYLSYNPGNKNITSSFYGEASANYNQTYGFHGVSAMLVFIARNALTANATTLSESLNQRNLGLSGRFTYSFENRYLSEFNFGFNGSEKFAQGSRWGFFPSFGLGWVISNEDFWENGPQKLINNLKIKGTYGLVGNDDIGAERFFYLSEVNINGGRGYTTGYDYSYQRNGVSIKNYPNPDIGWEISYKGNLGIELGMFKNDLNLILDIFNEKRTHILQSRADIPTEMGLWATPQANVGEAKGSGIDVSLDYNKIIRDLWFVGRTTFTYAKSSYLYYEEPDYNALRAPWKSKIGMRIGQQWGYVAERLFIDDADVINSARQDFGLYGAGDIKYMDINEDNVINSLDMVPIGHPTTPEINYGFGLSMGYKNFDVSFFFHGSERSSFWINAAAMSPFVQSGNLETGLAKFIADDYWSEDSQSPFAGWPRLSTYTVDNNTQWSTWFMKDGSYLRLKSTEAGYSLPYKLASMLKLNSCRIYVSGTNLLLLFNKFKFWDVEMGGNGLGYPIQKTLSTGVNITF